MKIVFVTDPLSGFHPQVETTSFLIYEACRRGYDTFVCELKDLALKQKTLWAHVQRVQVTKTKIGFHYQIVKPSSLQLAKCDAIFLRKDPPVDINFIDHLSLFEFIEDQTLVVNRPSGIKRYGEKLLPLAWSQSNTDSLVTQNRQEVLKFLKFCKTIVLKPLNLSGGQGIVKLSAKDPSASSLIDILTQNQSRFIMAQKYLPHVHKGDKRILWLDGTILGAFQRKPHKNDFRGNLHSQATLKPSSVTKTEQDTIDNLTPLLRRHGLYFVGFDWIGQVLTEINTTSPMGLNEINMLNKTKSERLVLEWLNRMTS